MPSNYLKEHILRHTFMGETYTPPTKIYLAAFTDDTTEVTDSGYERQEITFSESNGTITNDSDVLFPISTETWGEVQYYVLFDENDNELERAYAITEDDGGNAVFPTVEKNVQFGLSKGDLTLKITKKKQDNPKSNA